MEPQPTLVWLRRDLRLADHPALADATARGGMVVPVFVLDEAAPHQPGGAARWWLHTSLTRLSEEIAARGGCLIFRRGDTATELIRLAAETGAKVVAWNRRAEPHERAREARISSALATEGIEARTFSADLLSEPGTVHSRAGGNFQLFTAFWRSLCTRPPPPRPLPIPERLPPPSSLAPSLALDELGLLPRPRWWDGLAAAWQPGEAAAARRLADFLDRGLDAYAARRDRPAETGTSRLSPHLAFGEIGPRQIWHAVSARGPSDGGDSFLRELGWREFSYALLNDHPELPEQPLRPEFAGFPWRPEPGGIEAWRTGTTGFPIVDAGMRQLWRTGWMHNRVRMIVASFLVKDLLTPWQDGEAWFWDTLVDADLAVNATSWQWVAGCGVDAAPYFRIFNPILQGEKFDPRGRYVRTWLPELAGLPDLVVHRPWQADPATLAAAGVRLGHTYPRPVLDHGAARRRALAAYTRIRGSALPS